MPNYLSDNVVVYSAFAVNNLFTCGEGKLTYGKRVSKYFLTGCRFQSDC